ncbi:MAG TPA: DUF4164 family protein [Caulobacteraceae bacterium]|nr:DUF4164 family protein [Caulobacteraceae bacterium]
MTDQPYNPLGFDEAVRRLDHALARLEVRMSALSSQAEGANGNLFDDDRSKLAAELDTARSRERELENAGQAASEALERAITRVRAALGS